GRGENGANIRATAKSDSAPTVKIRISRHVVSSHKNEVARYCGRAAFFYWGIAFILISVLAYGYNGRK
ncbi:MAG: hypothetical protein ACI90R_001028, partial [Alteromonas macleodii]